MNLIGGADRDRTDDLLNAIQALSQLSYGPTFGGNECEESGVRVRNSIEKVKPCKRVECQVSKHAAPGLITHYLPLTISSAWRRVLSVILMPPSMRATSSTRSPSLSLSTVVEVRSLTTSLRTM